MTTMAQLVKEANKISVLEDFSDEPGPRYEWQGDHSGEAFLKELLLPAFESALGDNSTLIIDLDGVEGYSSSFLDGSFGELARKFGAKKVLEIMEFKSLEEPYLIDEIIYYVNGKIHK